MMKDKSFKTLQPLRCIFARPKKAQDIYAEFSLCLISSIPPPNQAGGIEVLHSLQIFRIIGLLGL